MGEKTCQSTEVVPRKFSVLGHTLRDGFLLKGNYMGMSEELSAIREQVLEGIAKATNLEELEKVRVASMGKKGSLTAIMRMMGQVPADQRPQMGQLANTVRANVETAIRERQLALKRYYPSRSSFESRYSAPH